jgi:hypothetical protein
MFMFGTEVVPWTLMPYHFFCVSLTISLKCTKKVAQYTSIIICE